jgi:hypothetical protein
MARGTLKRREPEKDWEWENYRLVGLLGEQGELSRGRRIGPVVLSPVKQQRTCIRQHKMALHERMRGVKAKNSNRCERRERHF